MTRWVVRRRRRPARRAAAAGRGRAVVAAGVVTLTSTLSTPGLPAATSAASSGSAAGSAAAPAPAQAQAARPGAPCPDPFPIADVTAGMTATGLTVEQGTAPDRFTATVLGVLDDGVGPGADMIIVDTDSPAIRRAEGVWAGMSGSPVYARDGRLIGAVAYSLGLPSPIAGLTPAADMRALLDRTAPSLPASTSTPPSASPSSGPAASRGAPAVPAAPATVALPAALRDRVVATGDVTAAEATAGLRRLPVPLGVSGVSQGHLDDTAARLEGVLPGVQVHATAAAPLDPPDAPPEVGPGRNFATAIAYGDVTVSGVGTATMICPAGSGDSGDGDDGSDGSDDGGTSYVLAFGHPLGWLGATSLSAHTASAVYVQPDPLLGPTKLANLGGPAGTLDQDRQAGTRARLGAPPPSSRITSTVTATDDDTTRSHTTRVNVAQFLSIVAADHVTAALDSTADRIGGGSARLRWVVRGTRAGGAPFVLDVTDRYADLADISGVASQDLMAHLAAIDVNPFEQARVTDVELTADVSATYTQYTVGAVQVRQPDGSYVPAPGPAGPPLPLPAGGTLDLRLTLQPYRGDGPVREVDVAVEVPASAAGSTGLILAAGGAATGIPPAPPPPPAPPGSPAPPAPPTGPLPPTEPASFDDLLAQLQGHVPNNAVTASLVLAGQLPTGTPPAQALADRVVTGQRAFPVTIAAPAT